MRLALLIVATFFPFLSQAQNTVQWTTNYYTVTGASIPEIRASLARARPWREHSTLDATTQWHIEWRYRFTRSDSGCRCTSFATTTTIKLTLPRWTRPADAQPEVTTNWDRYITALRGHELGHAQIGLAAAAEQQRRISNVGAARDCDALKETIETLARQIVDDYTRRDAEYDERTDHGVKQGAFLPARGPRRGPGAPPAR